MGSSSLHYMRRHIFDVASIQRKVPEPLEDCPMTSSQLRELNLDNGRFGSDPIHLAAPSQSLRIAKRSYRYTVRSGLLPETAFRQVEPGICIASPEYCLLQASKVLSRFQLLELCMELCGKYALANESDRGFVSREFSLASVNSIQRFLSQMKGEPGVQALQKMLPYALDGSRSPMETRTYILMCLPKKLGGYGLPRPAMNHRIELTSEEQLVAKRRYFECDMCWPDQKIVLEYDGDANHSARDDRDRDSVKRNILLSNGFTVFTVTSRQVINEQVFDNLVCEVSKQLGFRLKCFPETWVSKRARLRAELFKSMGKRAAKAKVCGMHES